MEGKCLAFEIAEAFDCLQVTCQHCKHIRLFIRQFIAGLRFDLIGKSVQLAFFGRGVTSILGLFGMEEFT